ncbi:MAG: M3 family oligoendopeptidase [Fimbriimonadaceae bacterium]
MAAIATPSYEWDLDFFFPGPDSRELAAAKVSLISAIDAYERALHNPTVDSVLTSLENVMSQFPTIYGYLYCLVSVDTRNEAALSQQSEMDALYSRLKKLQTRFAAWVGTLDVEAEIEASPRAKDHAYVLRKLKFHASHLMSPAEEALASKLAPSAGMAWGKLYDTFSSQIEIQFEGKAVGMASLRNVAYDESRERRRLAYEAELVAWKLNDVPIAAAMNGIKGVVNTLSERRGWTSPLAQAAWENGIDEATLEAMMTAAHEAFPDFRRYMNAKAKAIGVTKLEWYDLFAPLPSDESHWSVERGCDFVAEQFDTFSKKMGDFARRSYAENWIDFPPKLGKVGGAYCDTLKDEISRILMNYDGSFNNVKTLAHELGHAYHSLCLSQKPVLLRDIPSTLAETASIFCETIVKNAALAQFEGKSRLALLEACIMGPCQTVVDITSRYLFEKAAFEGRKARDMSAGELCEAMTNAQKQTYGDALASYHPYMWAAKPHYYSESSFYNFPYMFGLLFALGLYKIYEQNPDEFRANYDQLLANSGSADAPTLCAGFGLDCRSVEFWRGSLDVIRKDIDAFEASV